MRKRIDNENESQDFRITKLEIKLEKALREEFTDDSIYPTRDQWRRVAFTSDTQPTYLTASALKYNLNQHAIKLTQPYKRILEGMLNGPIKPNCVKKVVNPNWLRTKLRRIAFDSSLLG